MEMDPNKPGDRKVRAMRTIKLETAGGLHVAEGTILPLPCLPEAVIWKGRVFVHVAWLGEEPPVYREKTAAEVVSSVERLSA